MYLRRPIQFVTSLVSALLPLVSWSAPSVRDIRLSTQAEGTRVVLELTESARQKIFTLENPARVVIDLPAANLIGKLPVGEGVVKNLRAARRDNGDLRIVLDVSNSVQPHVIWLAADAGSGPRLVLDLPSGVTAPPINRTPAAPIEVRNAATQPAVALPVPADQVLTPVKSISTLAGGRDLIVAIDAGHGGEDPGAIGGRGTREKNVTLAIARMLKERVDAEPGMRAVLTRDGDYFVPLRERINRARQAQADMFISIHADSVANAGPSGSSVFTLSSKRATSEAARFLADRENASDLIGGVSLDDKSGLLASVLLDLSQGASMSASMDAAGYVLKQLDSAGNIHHDSVQQASFKVLTSPDIPSMLVETAFISNPVEEARLADAKHQSRIADAVLAGVRDYFYTNAPPGTRVAQLKASLQARAN
jgi:N-acetylmuramoyl-L-alanine amidase